MAGDDLDALIARADPDRYVATFFAPRALRADLIALYAFDHEVGRIGEIAHEPMVGHIRLAWWREQIGAIYGGAAVRAPVAEATGGVIARHALPREIFDAYLDARAADFDEAPFEDEAALQRHAVAVSGGIIALAARVLGAGDGADAAASSAGIGVAYAGHLGALAHNANRRRCRLPAAWLAEAGLNIEDVFAGAPGVGAVVARVATIGLRALGETNGQKFPTRAMPALAAATLARPVLAREKASPLKPAPALPSWQRVARVAFANLTWRI